jgi:hypothetical protein
MGKKFRKGQLKAKEKSDQKQDAYPRINFLMQVGNPFFGSIFASSCRGFTRPLLFTPTILLLVLFRGSTPNR